MRIIEETAEPKVEFRDRGIQVGAWRDGDDQVLGQRILPQPPPLPGMSAPPPPPLLKLLDSLLQEIIANRYIYEGRF